MAKEQFHAASLADLLSAARHRRFVGRAKELDLFRSALEAHVLPFHVLYLHGPGGVGKTALLHEFRGLCEAALVPAYHLDARDVEPSAASFMEALDRLAGLSFPEGGHSVVAHDERFVILIDTFEELEPLSRWIREQFLPRLPASVLIVFSGRHPRPAAWRADAGLSSLIRDIALRNLSDDESRHLLEQRQVPTAQHETVQAFAHGYPLALALIADRFEQQPEMEFRPEASPDLVGTLLKRFLDEMPSKAHREALYATAIVRHTSESLLSSVLDRDDVHDLFEWLRTLSFIEVGKAGLFPHDLVREALVADVRWHSPEHYDALHRKARQYYTGLLRRAHAHSHKHILAEYTFLHRDNPIVRPFYQELRKQWQRYGLWTENAMRPSDRAALEAMVMRHEGADSTALAVYWMDRQPQGVQVIRGTEEATEGFIFTLRLQDTTDEDRARDPAVEAACAYLDAHAPLRSGEQATLFRFWMGHEAYQQVSAVQSLAFVHTVRHYLTTPRLAFTFLPCRDSQFWSFVMAYAHMQRLPEADFEVGSHTYGVFGQDWRVVPPNVWLDRLAERNTTTRAAELDAPAEAPTILVLDKAGFAKAVKEALHGWTLPEALRESPLVRSRLVVEEVGRGAELDARVEALRRQLHEAAAALEASPRDAKYFAALAATYFEPERTQERAAEHLEVPFSTYRRHLKRGIEHVVGTLWHHEVGG